MSNHYKKFLRLLEKWPIDKTKQGRWEKNDFHFIISILFVVVFRDLGQNLRDKLQQVLGGSNIVSVNDAKFDAQFNSLENLANNVYQEQYPRKLKSTSTGLTGEQCRQVLSSEFLEYINEDKKN